MRDHLSESELLEVHTGEIAPTRRERLESHARTCPRCRDRLEALAWVEAALTDWPAPEPPVDGLARVMDRIGKHQAVRPTRDGLRPALATLLGVAVGTLAIAWGGDRLWGLVLAPQLSLGAPWGALVGRGLATLILFGVGSLITLALTPVLLMETAREQATGSTWDA